MDKYSIILQDGTRIDNIEHHGTIFFADEPLDISIFGNNTALVQILDASGNIVEELANVTFDELIPPPQDAGKFEFCFKSDSPSEIMNTIIQQLVNDSTKDNRDITEIQEAIIDLYEMILSKQQ